MKKEKRKWRQVKNNSNPSMMKKKLKTILNFVNHFILERQIISKKKLMKIIRWSHLKIKYTPKLKFILFI